MNDNLAPVFLDNKPVSLKDPKPKLSAILSASGHPETTDVKWLQFNAAGKPLRSEEVLDRTTDPSKPIYLTSGKGSQGASGKGGQSAGGQGQGASGQWAGGQGGKPKEGSSASNPNIGKTAGSKHPTTDDDDSGMQDDAEAGGEDRRKGDQTA